MGRFFNPEHLWSYQEIAEKLLRRGCPRKTSRLGQNVVFAGAKFPRSITFHAIMTAWGTLMRGEAPCCEGLKVHTHTRPLTANYCEMFHFIKVICLSNLMETSQAAKGRRRQDFKESNHFRFPASPFNCESSSRSSQWCRALRWQWRVPLQVPPPPLSPSSEKQ